MPQLEEDGKSRYKHMGKTKEKFSLEVTSESFRF